MTPKELRKQGYDIARYRMRELLLHKAFRMKTGAGREPYFKLARIVGLEFADYDGDIPEGIPHWVLGGLE